MTMGSGGSGGIYRPEYSTSADSDPVGAAVAYLRDHGAITWARAIEARRDTYEKNIAFVGEHIRVLETHVNKLRRVLQEIADGKGECETCGLIAVGEGPGATACDCGHSVWTDRDPRKVAQSALDIAPPKSLESGSKNEAR